MSIEIVRRIRGNLHGSIDVSEYEDLVIGHKYFQRLRLIKQTAFLSYVFPGASHTRFEHSLGVMHLAARAWEKIFDNQKRLQRSCLKNKNFAAIEKQFSQDNHHGSLFKTFFLIDELFQDDYVAQCLRVAALLHDVGHPPFSHSGEKFLPTLDSMIEQKEDSNIPQYLGDYLVALRDMRPDLGKKPVRHEMFTIIILDQIINEVNAKSKDLDFLIEAQDVAAIILPQIPPVEDSPLSKNFARQICHQILSGEIDVDRMDYLLRDSQEAGVVYGLFDVDRILNSLALYFDESSQTLNLGIQFAGLAAFEDYLRARQSMYVQLYFHKTSVACEAMLKYLRRYLQDWALPLHASEYAKYHDYNMKEVFESKVASGQLEKADSELLQGLIEDLFSQRVLWKRIYEKSTLNRGENNIADIAKIEKILLDNHIVFEKVRSQNELTKFKMRSKGSLSENYLRLIKKDEKQFMRVLPIEDYSSLISDKPRISLERLYVPLNQSREAEELLQKEFFGDSNP